MKKYIINKVDIILLLCLSILLSGVLNNMIPSSLRLLIILIILIIIIRPFSSLKKERVSNTWKNLKDGTVFKILTIGTTFDTSQTPSKKTGYLKIETRDLKKVLVVFPTHISCWEGITPTEGKNYKKDGNYFTEIR